MENFRHQENIDQMNSLLKKQQYSIKINDETLIINDILAKPNYLIISLSIIYLIVATYASFISSFLALAISAIFLILVLIIFSARKKRDKRRNKKLQLFNDVIVIDYNSKENEVIKTDEVEFIAFKNDLVNNLPNGRLDILLKTEEKHYTILIFTDVEIENYKADLRTIGNYLAEFSGIKFIEYK